MSRVAPARRALAIRLAVLAIGLLLVARLVQVQIFQHRSYRVQAAAQWTSPHEIPPDRGDLHDRRGRPVALSVEAWRIGVSTSLLAAKDEDRVVRTLANVLGEKADSIRRKLRRAGGDHVVLRRETTLPPSDRELLRGLRAVTTERLRRRVYPYDGVGAALIGFHRRDGQGQALAEGLERGLDAFLAGRSGRGLEIATAHPTRSLGHVVLEPAQHGRDLVLTLDAELQRLCEDELAMALERTHAAGGSVLILDPRNGDLLAAASAPLLTSRANSGFELAVWRNRNFTDTYEPGSVFKVFSAAALLASGAVDTATVFDCSLTDFGSFRLRESEGHSFGILSMTGALVHSSNVWFGRAAGNLGAEEFYRELTEFGFGQRTSAPYPAQAVGVLRAPDAWSRRSQATIAIGQEISVTPLQLGLAVAAVANGGWLHAPRLVREIRAHDGTLERRVPPVRLRRVMPEHTATLLRHLMARVVSEGTGIAASDPALPAAGKTGTAQKSRDGRGYTPGCYVATFAGFVPVEHPRLVVVAILDEPDRIHHYAAQSAVPLFGRVVEEIARRTDWLDGAVPALSTTVVVDRGDRVTVPDVLFLTAERAARRLAAAGLTPRAAAGRGVVVEQIPAPGSQCRPATEVRLSVATRGTPATGEPRCPDLRGLSNRELRSLAARLGIPLAIEGIGYVRSQWPEPGAALGREGLRVKMGW